MSEKVYEGLIAGTLPVYRGADNINSFLPEHSFINANDMTPRALATMLIELATDEVKYNAYFDFKKRPLAKTFIAIANQSYCHPSALCRLCTYHANALGSGGAPD